MLNSHDSYFTFVRRRKTICASGLMHLPPPPHWHGPHRSRLNSGILPSRYFHDARGSGSSVLRPGDGPAAARRRCEAADRLLRHGVSDRGAILEGQLGLEEALRSVPRADFRAWAVGLARLSEVQTAISSRRESSVHLQCSPLSDLFFEAVEESPHPGDKALGLANWLYASYVAWWHQSSNTECPLRKNKDLRRRAAVTPSSPRADASGALTCRLGMASMDIANYSRLETMC
ncbi:unnamed protein product [Prorocentrum cordatum]|uniref:Uncharacterized protein n=1 Tax=Prorocentrum cordatum TaxID=2364126 RepID=A0ABN9TZX5_9DINO|nr:unnamed protein product [Polarella glacialis]